MRTLIVVFALVAAGTLAGCTQQAEPEADPLVRTCPAWTAGPDRARHTINFPFFGGNDSKIDEIGPGIRETYRERPMDRIAINFGEVNVTDGELVGRVFRADSDERLAVRDFRYDRGSEVVPQIRFTAGHTRNATIYVDLAAPDAEAQPGSIRIEWAFARNLDGNPDTDSGAAMAYEATFLYRICGL